MYRLLIIEDEVAIAELLKYAFEKEEFSAEIACDGKTALKRINEDPPDVILLDLMLPDMNGLNICRAVTNEKNIPLIILSAKNDQMDKLIGLEYGADDYITKPFDMREVMLRVKSVLRRIEITRENAVESSVMESQGVRLDMDRHEVTKDGCLIDLTPKEFTLLEVLLANKGKVLTRGDLLKKVWDFDYIGDTRTVDIHIQRLRKKLDSDCIITTVFGIGYKIPEDVNDR